MAQSFERRALILKAQSSNSTRTTWCWSLINSTLPFGPMRPLVIETVEITVIVHLIIDFGSEDKQLRSLAVSNIIVVAAQKA